MTALPARRLLVTGSTGTLGRQMLAVSRQQEDLFVRALSRTDRIPLSFYSR